ncbi:MAG: hypothetical protein KatS3mg030_016 [Saprospiraceae bacterium]|nr:MAG: hypothetical protein KatS3mg030_016 [Saprospiraceae bacterium]
MRKLVITILSLALLAGAFLGARAIVNQKTATPPARPRTAVIVYTDTVKNRDIPVVITSSGNLVARQKVDIFSEVQGIFEKSDHLYRPGSFYRKGELLLGINSDEHRATLLSQKSNLYNQIVQSLPDLRIDYPHAFKKWEDYVKNFDMNAPLKPLPTPDDDREKLFITGRNFFTLWYNVKNLEERLVKYQIRAPFSGILIQADVNLGTLVRPGQRLGVLLDPSVFEVELPVNASYLNQIAIGKPVKLTDIDNTREWIGKVVRINGTVNTTSQMVQVFAEVQGAGLYDGLFVQATIEGKSEQNVYEIDRKLLQSGNQVFSVADSILQLIPVQPVFFTEKTAVVRGIPDGTAILALPVPGAHQGMVVSLARQ